MPNKSQYALIRWTQSGMTDVVSCNTIKLQDCEVGKSVKLMWSDRKTGVKGLHSAKILKIGCK